MHRDDLCKTMENSKQDGSAGFTDTRKSSELEAYAQLDQERNDSSLIRKTQYGANIGDVITPGLKRQKLSHAKASETDDINNISPGLLGRISSAKALSPQQQPDSRQQDQGNSSVTSFAPPLNLLQQDKGFTQSLQGSLLLRTQAQQYFNLNQNISAIQTQRLVPWWKSTCGIDAQRNQLCSVHDNSFLLNLSGVGTYPGQSSFIGLRASGLGTPDSTMPIPDSLISTDIGANVLQSRSDQSSLLTSLTCSGLSDGRQLDSNILQLLSLRPYEGMSMHRTYREPAVSVTMPNSLGLYNSFLSGNRMSRSIIESSPTGLSTTNDHDRHALDPLLVSPASISHQDLYARGTTADADNHMGDGPRLVLYMESCDDESLSAYQCLVRKQIELFEANAEDVESNAQGRNKPIIPGQVGIRCRHCCHIPPRHRTRGAIYYPAKLLGLYQAAQNMATSHLCQNCQLIPDSFRQDLIELKDRKSSAGGGKQYWANCVRIQGVIELDGVLCFMEKVKRE